MVSLLIGNPIHSSHFRSPRSRIHSGSNRPSFSGVSLNHFHIQLNTTAFCVTSDLTLCFPRHRRSRSQENVLTDNSGRGSPRPWSDRNFTSQISEVERERLRGEDRGRCSPLRKTTAGNTIENDSPEVIYSGKKVISTLVAILLHFSSGLLIENITIKITAVTS